MNTKEMVIAAKSAKVENKVDSFTPTIEVKEGSNVKSESTKNEKTKVLTVAENEAAFLKENVLKPLKAKYKANKETGFLDYRLDFTTKQRIGKETINSESCELISNVTVKGLVSKLLISFEGLSKRTKVVKLFLVSGENENVVNNHLTTFDLSLLKKVENIEGYIIKSIFRNFNSESDLTNESLFISYFMSRGNENICPNLDSIFLYEAKKESYLTALSENQTAKQSVLHIESDKKIEAIKNETKVLLESIKGLLS